MKRLVMRLSDAEISYKNSSNLQGVLFENISKDYAEFLHTQQRHPYSQFIYKENEKLLWCVNALNDDAEREIIEPLLSESFRAFEIKKQNKKIQVLEKEVFEVRHQELVTEFYNSEPEHIIRVEFITPTAFKQRGKYIFYPDLRLLYQSLMNKYSGILAEMEMLDEDILEMLAEKSEIKKYRLKSVLFPLEGISIPAFQGSVTIKINGADTIAAYARMLFRFGGFSGVGIKSAMGMGALKVQGDAKK